MGRIRELDPTLINKIAAGEVIESSHSVVKELVENSLDAHSSKILIETISGGLEKILISDNGDGFEEDDLEISLHRHSTSKINTFNDLESLETFGFRGEALSSIASVSKLILTSGTTEDKAAWRLETSAGSILDKKNVTGRKGTVLEIRDLFFNTPVRRKFLKSDRSEDKKIRDRVSIHSLSRTDVEFCLVQNGKEVFRLKPSNLKDRIVEIYGDNIRDHLLDVQLERRGISVSGFISDPDFYRSNRLGQFFFINGRPVELKNSSYLLKKSYDELLPHGAHPWCFLFFKIDPRYIDVNVHPTKKEIRFLDENGFTAFFLEAISNVLRSKTPVTFLELKRRLSTPVVQKNQTINKSVFQQILHDDIFKDPTPVKSFPLESVGPGVHMEELRDEKKIEVHREFIPKKHYGILFGTFILAEAEDGLYIIDQHTAHERIRYEEVLNRFRKSETLSQPLLSPIRLELSIQEAEEIIEKNDEYRKVGILLDSLGGGTILIREVPGFIEPGTEREVVQDFLNKSLEDNSTPLYDILAKCIACRSAIKKNDFLSDHLLGEILNRLSYCENPSRCPHGRPTLVKLSRDDLEKMFHRK